MKPFPSDLGQTGWGGIEEEGRVELPPLGKLAGLTSWELAILPCIVCPVLPLQGSICMCSQMFFLCGGEGMVSSFIPLAKRGDRLILHIKMLWDNENWMLYISTYTFCAWSLSTDTFQVLHEISIGDNAQKLVLNEKTSTPKPPGWCAGPGPQWHHLPPTGSLQTPSRCGCVCSVCLSEWLVF